MKSKLDTAMVQMGKPDEVGQAINCLHGTYLFGQQLALRLGSQIYVTLTGIGYGSGSCLSAINLHFYTVCSFLISFHFCKVLCI